MDRNGAEARVSVRSGRAGDDDVGHAAGRVWSAVSSSNIIPRYRAAA